MRHCIAFPSNSIKMYLSTKILGVLFHRSHHRLDEFYLLVGDSIFGKELFIRP